MAGMAVPVFLRRRPTPHCLQASEGAAAVDPGGTSTSLTRTEYGLEGPPMTQVRVRRRDSVSRLSFPGRLTAYGVVASGTEPAAARSALAKPGAGSLSMLAPTSSGARRDRPSRQASIAQGPSALSSGP